MIKRFITVVTLLAGAVGLHVVVASPASAGTLERCYNYELDEGITFRYCLTVDSANARASGTVLWNPVAWEYTYRIIPTIIRDGVGVTNASCNFFLAGATPSGSSTCNAYAGNPPSTQRFKATFELLVGPGEDTAIPFETAEIIS